MKASRRSFFAWLGAGLASCARAFRKSAASNGRASEPALRPQPARDGAKEEPGLQDLFAGTPVPDDPLELLYSRRLSFEAGQPLITVRVVEGRKELTFAPRGPLTALARKAGGGSLPAVQAGASGRWRVRLLEAQPGVGASWVELERLRYSDKDGLARARAEWALRCVAVRVATVGHLYGIEGHVVDTRSTAVLAEGDATESGARRQAEELSRRFDFLRPQIHRELSGRPSGRLELVDPSGEPAAVGESAIELRCTEGIVVPEVEFGMGYAFHGFEARTYPGRLFATVDASGLLALIAALPMERLVRGVVPSEIFPSAHLEALKAQAVTARGEILAKIGARHLGDPYLLCSEQHCQVYKGSAAEGRATDAAVLATRGEALFARVPSRMLQGDEGAALASAPPLVSRLVDTVYSAVCGGWTEDNDAVWGDPKDPSLRGRRDFEASARSMRPFLDGVGEALASRFVHLEKVESYCALSGLARPDKVRWRRTFKRSEMDELCAPLGVGAVQKLAVEGRGVSGRARALRVEGDRGSARVFGELAIRRLFRNLNSGMFVVERSGSDWLFVGGGWGHGSGMCQLGAIGRAQRGATYRDILDWYYSGAAPERIY